MVFEKAYTDELVT